MMTYFTYIISDPVMFALYMLIVWTSVQSDHI